MPVLLLACLWPQAGCVSVPDHPPLREPSRSLPSDYALASGAPQAPAGESQPAQAGSPFEPSPRERFFAEPELQALIQVALEGNQELNIRVQEILIAQSEVLARSGEYRPRVDVGAGVGVEKVGETTSQGASDEADGVPENLPDFSLGLAASWELDVWKRLRNLEAAAREEYLASVEGRNFLVTRLVAEIASSYYELLALDSQLDVLQRNVAIQQDALEVVRLEKQGARVTELAVQRFEAEVARSQSRRFELEQRIVETENRLNFLVGRYPQRIFRDRSAFDAPIESLSAAGSPRALLENRPDVKRAEHLLTAASLDVSAARARFYPALSLEAGLGYEAWKAGRLLSTPDSVFYGLLGRVTAPLLNRRGIKAEFFARIAEQVRRSFEYEQTLLQAFIEVSNRISLVDKLQSTYDLQSRQVDFLNQAIEVSNVLFRSARADYMEVLLTRRDALEAQMERIETRLRQRRAQVELYQALGGGWR